MAHASLAHVTGEGRVWAGLTQDAWPRVLCHVLWLKSDGSFYVYVNVLVAAGRGCTWCTCASVCVKRASVYVSTVVEPWAAAWELVVCGTLVLVGVGEGHRPGLSKHVWLRPTTAII